MSTKSVLTVNLSVNINMASENKPGGRNPQEEQQPQLRVSARKGSTPVSVSSRRQSSFRAPTPGARKASSLKSLRMPIVLYHLSASPPCKAVHMVAKMIDLDLELRDVDVLNNEQFTPEFLKLNPAHTIPTLFDNGFVLWESRAIMKYLVNTYSPDSSLYPNNIKKRAIIDQMLDFEIGTVYKAVSDYFFSYLLYNKEKCTEQEKRFTSSMKIVDKILSERRFIAGDNLTIADISCAACLSVPEAVYYDFSSFPYVMSWQKRVEEAMKEVIEINREGVRIFRSRLHIKEPSPQASGKHGGR